MRRTLKFAGHLCIAAALLIGLVTVWNIPVGGAAFPGTNGKIAFMRDMDEDDGNRDFEILTMNPNGSGPTNITNNPARDEDPEWSPTGNRILFASDRDGGDMDIFVMNPDGSSPTLITGTANSNDVGPTWAPSGTQLAFTKFTQTGDGLDFDIYIANVSGGASTKTVDAAASPEWAPTGNRIAFVRGFTPSDPEEDAADIFVKNLNDNSETRLTNSADADNVSFEPNWSPDGTKIVFSTDRDSTADADNFEIYVMNADGSAETRITNHGGHDYLPAWSPDGTKIVFTSDREGNPEIFTMNPDGSNVTRLTSGGVGLGNHWPNWGSAASGSSPTASPTTSPTPTSTASPPPPSSPAPPSSPNPPPPSNATESGQSTQDTCSATGVSSVDRGRINDSTVTPSQRVTVSGGGFSPSTRLEINFCSRHTNIGTATSSRSGSYSSRVRIPSTASSGAHRIEVVGNGAAGGTRVTFVDVQVSRPTRGLVATGASPQSWLMVAVGLAALGAMLLLAERQTREFPA